MPPRRAARAAAMAAEEADAAEQGLSSSLRRSCSGEPAGGASARRGGLQGGPPAVSFDAACVGGSGARGDDDLDLAAEEQVGGCAERGRASVRAPVRPLPPVTAVVAPGKRGAFKQVHERAPASGAPGLDGRSGAPASSGGGGSSAVAALRADWSQGVAAELPSYLRTASAVQQGWLASSRVAAGFMAGAAVLELTLLSQARDEPLSPFLLYADSALHFQRLYLWGGLASCVGAGLVILRRRRSGHYAYYPATRWLSWLLIALNAAVVAFTIGLREPSFRVGAPAARAAIPYRVPTSSDAYQDHVRATGPFADPVPAAVLLRALLCVAALLLAYLPDADEPPERAVALEAAPADRAAAALGGRLLWPHLLAGDAAEAPDGGASVLSRGAMFAVAFGQPRPLPASAPDGKPPLAPLEDEAMSRAGYATRAATLVAFLSLDLVVNLLSCSLVWEQAYLAGLQDGAVDADAGQFARMLPDLMGLILFCVCRVVVGAQLFAMVTQTTAFKIGMLSQLIKHFRRPFLVHALAFVTTLVLIGMRVVAAADTSQPLLFWGASPLGTAYTLLLFLHLPATVLFYVSTLDALRRLARSEYYLATDRSADF